MANEINPYITTLGHLKKRVLFVITQSEMGGAQRFILNLLTHLDKEKYEAMVAIGNTGNGDLFRALHAQGTPTHKLAHLVRDANLIEDLRAVSELRNLMKEYRPETVFLNSSKAGFVGSLAARCPTRLKNTKIVYRIGGWSFNDPGSRWQKWGWIVLEWLSAKWKDIIIVNNQHDFDQAVRLKIRPRKNLKLVYNGIETYKLGLVSKEEARIRLELPADKYIIGTIANFYPAKGLEYLVRAAYYFQDNDNTVFVVIGDGRERAGLEALIKELGLENKVLLAGQVPDAYKYLAAFDAFALPSVKEGFPWSLIEAMAAKLPIVATRVGAVPEIIEDYKNGILVESGDPQMMADKLKEIMNTVRLQKELGIQAHQTVLFKFELDKMVKCIEELL